MHHGENEDLWRQLRYQIYFNPHSFPHICVCTRAHVCARVCVCVLDLRFSKKCVLKSFSMIVDLPISYVFLLLFV